MKAIWNGEVIADSDATVVIEGNHYFPPDAVRADLLRPSARHSTCHWKGVASYHDIVVGDAVNEGGAWYYPEPLPAAAEITGYIAFWNGVEVTAG